jgi:hypothetical protein
MDLFIKIVGIVLAGVFLFLGGAFLFMPSKVIHTIQKQKFGRIAEPRKTEKIFAAVIGILLILSGLYFLMISILSLL